MINVPQRNQWTQQTEIAGGCELPTADSSRYAARCQLLSGGFPYCHLPPADCRLFFRHGPSASPLSDAAACQLPAASSSAHCAMREAADS